MRNTFGTLEAMATTLNAMEHNATVMRLVNAVSGSEAVRSEFDPLIATLANTIERYEELLGGALARPMAVPAFPPPPLAASPVIRSTAGLPVEHSPAPVMAMPMPAAVDNKSPRKSRKGHPKRRTNAPADLPYATPPKGSATGGGGGGGHAGSGGPSWLGGGDTDHDLLARLLSDTDFADHLAQGINEHITEAPLS